MQDYVNQALNWWLVRISMTILNSRKTRKEVMNSIIKSIERKNQGCQEQFSKKVKQSWKWKIVRPLQFLCGGRLPGGMNKNNRIWIGRCIFARVNTLDHVDQTSLFWPKNTLSRSKNKRVWFLGAREPIQMKFLQMVEPLYQFIKLAIKIFWLFIIKKTMLVLLCPLSAILTNRKNKHNHIRNFSESTLSTWTKLTAELT